MKRKAGEKIRYTSRQNKDKEKVNIGRLPEHEDREDRGMRMAR